MPKTPRSAHFMPLPLSKDEKPLTKEERAAAEEFWKLTEKIAAYWTNRFPFLKDEISQASVNGLLEGARKWKPERGSMRNCVFTYVSGRIRGFISMHYERKAKGRMERNNFMADPGGEDGAECLLYSLSEDAQGGRDIEAIDFKEWMQRLRRQVNRKHPRAHGLYGRILWEVYGPLGRTFAEMRVREKKTKQHINKVDKQLREDLAELLAAQ